MSLKTKLIIAFGGLIAILAVVGALTVRTMNESGKAIDLILRENYESIVACYKMQNALERLDRLAEVSLWQKVPNLDVQVDLNKKDFEKSLRFQQGNVTVPGEQELTNELSTLWLNYRKEMEHFFKVSNARHVFSRNLPASSFAKIAGGAGNDPKNSRTKLTEYGVGGWAVAQKSGPDQKRHVISLMHRHSRGSGFYCVGNTFDY